MTWLIGIDEAGYGPNLGPLVQTLVACRLPDHPADADLWELLKTAVRRAADPADHRPLVADSKLVYSTARGLAALEHGVLSFVNALTLGDLVSRLAPDRAAELGEECWYVGATALPSAEEGERVAAAAEALQTAAAAIGLTEIVCRSAVICAPRFNRIVQRWDSKGVVLGLGLVQLIQTCLPHTPDEPLHFFIDKHGGRNQYTHLLVEAFPSGIILTETEGAECSRYVVRGLEQPVQATFLPRADGCHFPVALASMVSKYLRELLMQDFNTFWARHVPGLKPTAGYPSDATRYFAAIRPILAQLGLREDQVWRCR